MLKRNELSVVSAHPYVALYVAAFVGVWGFSIATGTTEPSGRFVLHPIAQGLQYMLVVLAASLAGYRLRVEDRDEQAQVRFAWGDRIWEVAHDTGGRSFWSCVWVGIVAMEANIALLIAADLAVTGTRGSTAPGDYLAWIGAGIAAGAFLGMFSAVIPLAAAAVWRPRRAH